ASEKPPGEDDDAARHHHRRHEVPHDVDHLVPFGGERGRAERLLHRPGPGDSMSERAEGDGDAGEPIPHRPHPPHRAPATLRYSSSRPFHPWADPTPSNTLVAPTCRSMYRCVSSTDVSCGP